MNRENRIQSLMQKLTPLQLKFVAARIQFPKDKEAALAIGISPQTAYNWQNEEAGGIIREIISLSYFDAADVARERLVKLSNTAVDILEDEMKAGRATGNRFNAALEVLDRIGLIKQKQMQLDMTSAGEKIHTENTIIVREIMED